MIKTLIIFVFTALLFLLTSYKSPSQLNFTRSELNTISIYDQNVNSVVNITSVKLARTLWDYTPIKIQAGVGSGFVWNTKGHIVTNYHVVGDSHSFIITFHKNPKQYKAKLIGAEPRKDIAVLKLENPPQNLTPIKPGSSLFLKVGQSALAIGNPFEMESTLTQGIISALDRRIEGVSGVKIYGMIQTDASINPGNSGGPLLDSQGNLIGMNTVIFSKSGSSAGIGFAIPVNTIKRIVPQLIKHGRVIQPGLGIRLLPKQIQIKFGIKKGIVIGYFIDDDGPLAQAGLKPTRRDRYGRFFPGDVIIKVDDKSVNNYDDIYNTLEKYNVGDSVVITYLNDEKIKKIKIKLTAVPIE